MEEISFNYDKRVELDAKFQDLEKRRRHPAKYLAKEKIDMFNLQEVDHLKLLNKITEPAILAMKGEVKVHKKDIAKEKRIN